MINFLGMGIFVGGMLLFCYGLFLIHPACLYIFLGAIGGRCGLAVIE